MLSHKITKAQAVAILLTQAKRVGLDRILSEDVIRREFSSDLRTAGAVLAYIPLPNGVKFHHHKVGCVQMFALEADYMHDIVALLRTVEEAAAPVGAM
jgi:hypothetical protein